jgi:hypothetical protein
MAQQLILVGAVPNDNTGDPLRTAMGKVNANFTENYASVTTLTAQGTATVSYTPTLEDGGAGATFSGTGTGSYVLVTPNMVWVAATFTVTAVSGAATGQLFFSLPFTPAQRITMSVFGDGLAAACTALQSQTVNAFPSKLRIMNMIAGTATTVAAHVQVGTILKITGTFFKT